MLYIIYRMGVESMCDLSIAHQLTFFLIVLLLLLFVTTIVAL